MMFENFSDDELRRQVVKGSTLAAAVLDELLRRSRKEGFDKGFGLAAQVEQRRAKELLAQYVLDVLGKDRADGSINLGALGESVFAEPRSV